MSLFPIYIEEAAETEARKQEATKPVEYEINYETGQPTGKLVEGLEAIKVWIWLALKTVRYRYTIFTWDYGNELEELIGKGFTKEYLETEAKRMVEDCLSVNEYIKSISDFGIEIVNDKIKIKFTANTVYGEVQINV